MSTEDETQLRQVKTAPLWTDSSGIANHLHVSVRHVHNLTRRRLIPHLKLGRCLRFRIADVDAALKALEIKSVGHF